MNNHLKQIAILCALAFVVGNSFAQQVAKPEKVKVVETYSRLSVTFFMGSIRSECCSCNVCGENIIL